MNREEDIRVLATIVETFVREGNPVSSTRVRDAGAYAVSTATIRNRMAALEAEGYIAKTHVSSGRIPTDDGYRVYVDEVVAERVRDGREYASVCRNTLRSHTGDMSGIMMEASRLLASLSKNFAVVYGEVEEQSRVSRLQLVPLDGMRLLVVVNFVPSHERTTILRFDREFDASVVAAAGEQLMRLVSGLSPDEASDALDNAVRDNVTDEGIICREVAVNRDAIFLEPPAVELVFEERTHLLEQPELADPKTLQSILRILHNKRYLTSILADRSREGTEVTIGAEHDDDLLRSFSLVTSGYRMGAARGVLGIIGPTRMRYDIALSVVVSVARELRAIGEEFFAN